MDRPSRKTKVVNYCEAKDLNDDEDFACAMGPPSKKAREGGEWEHKKSLSKSSSQDSNSESTVSKQSRKPLDERLDEQDLEAAIALSLLNDKDGIEDQSPASKEAVKFEVLPDENTDPVSLHRSNCSVDGAILGLDEISSECETVSRQRTAAAKVESRKNLADNDDDYEPKLTLDSESDVDFSEPEESEDEEFTVKKTSKTKKKAKVPNNEKSKQPSVSTKKKPASKPSKSKSKAAAASTPVRSPTTAKVASKRPASSSLVSSTRPASSLSPAGGRISKWTPPGQIGRSPTSSQSVPVKSPGQGLRLGLSRLVRVKPLHPSVATH